MMDMVNMIAGRVEKMENKIQNLGSKVEGGAGGTGEDRRINQNDRPNLGNISEPSND